MLIADGIRLSMLIRMDGMYGNFAAGYLSGSHGIPFSLTRIAFDGLQKGIKPPVSRSAQNIGYFTGYYQFLIQNIPYYGIK